MPVPSRPPTQVMYDKRKWKIRSVVIKWMRGFIKFLSFFFIFFNKSDGDDNWMVLNFWLKIHFFLLKFIFIMVSYRFNIKALTFIYKQTNTSTTIIRQGENDFHSNFALISFFPCFQVKLTHKWFIFINCYHHLVAYHTNN